MPPEGFTNLSVSDATEEKLIEIMLSQELNSKAKAAELAADVTLAVLREVE